MTKCKSPPSLSESIPPRMVDRPSGAKPLAPSAAFPFGLGEADAPIYLAAFAAMVLDVHAPQDQLTEAQWGRAWEIVQELNGVSKKVSNLRDTAESIPTAFTTGSAQHRRRHADATTVCNGSGIRPSEAIPSWPNEGIDLAYDDGYRAGWTARGERSTDDAPDRAAFVAGFRAGIAAFTEDVDPASVDTNADFEAWQKRSADHGR